MITAKEVTNVLKQAIHGKITINLLGESWNDTYAGNVLFQFNDWHICFFNDCDSLDYCDYAIAPNKDKIEFWRLSENSEPDPLQLLSRDERKKLESLLKEAK